jgi:3-hydroxyacyl-[acyl-carrier-protein] dehydratase
MRLEYFELIDHIDDLRRDEGRIRARARVPSKSPVFEGHFPDYPLMPGVMLIEAMAQASGWLVLSRLDFKRMGILAAVKEAKLRQAVLPGADIEVEAEIEHEGSGYAVVSARVLNSGKLIADAEITLRIVPFPSQKFADSFHARAKAVGLQVEA